MYYAKSILDGGRIVCADDADYSFYLEEGLVCLECNRDVHLRNGNEKKAHFAHHKAVDESDRECSLRVTGYSQDWSSLTFEGKGQRRKLFHKYFLSLLAMNYLDFYTTIKIIRHKINIIKLEDITQKLCDYFCDNKDILIRECRYIAEKNYDNSLLLQKLIACEAIDYLCVPSSKSLLEQLIHYSIYKCFDSLPHDLNTALAQIRPADICQKVKQIILETPWLSTFSQEVDRNIHSRVKSNLKSYALPQQHFKEKGLSSAIHDLLDTESDALPLFYDNFLNLKLYLDCLVIYLLFPNDLSRKNPIAKITDFHIDKLSKSIIIDWEFIAINLGINTDNYLKQYNKWQPEIEYFLRLKMKTNFPIKFNLISGSSLQKKKI
ncbi:competence protein CoiA family protein [Fischerella sp. PCC 9605]|uniref:competence protein CoiA family protein n=1 Tax=Fischerella sp. PCC 9605 TaxID=1173024 RepID=UPI00047E40CD|nr:hypothetical protein [Fischerella sp. PCC 9605]